MIEHLFTFGTIVVGTVWYLTCLTALFKLWRTNRFHWQVGHTIFSVVTAVLIPSWFLVMNGHPLPSVGCGVAVLIVTAVMQRVSKESLMQRSLYLQIVRHN